MLLPSTLLTKNGLAIAHVTVTDDRVIADLVATRSAVPCPMCEQRAHRIHSRYRRTVADLPTQGVAVQLALATRRFWCDAPTCPRRIFAERFPSLRAAGARRTLRLSALYLALGLALGGEGGARMAGELGLTISPDTLLRATLAAPLPVHLTPHIVGVDAWSWRKGQRWGTILVDLERRRRIDILPDRTAGTLADWLATHPGIQVVARDRAGAYAEGIRHGAPTAVQVADRFHLVKNVGETLERVVHRHHPELRAAAAAVDQAVAARTMPHLSEQSAPLPTHPATMQTARSPSHAHEQRLARYQDVVALAQQGLGPTAIGQRVGLTRQTVAQWLCAGIFPKRAPYPRRQILITPYKPYLRDRWQAGCQNARQLWRDVQSQGFTGGHETVRRLVVQWPWNEVDLGHQRRAPGRHARRAGSSSSPRRRCGPTNGRTWSSLSSDARRCATPNASLWSSSDSCASRTTPPSRHGSWQRKRADYRRS